MITLKSPHEIELMRRAFSTSAAVRRPSSRKSGRSSSRGSPAKEDALE